MSIGRKEIEQIARLAKLAMKPEDEDGFIKDLSNVFKLVEQMAQVDTSQIAPLAHPLDTTQRLRPDVITAKNEREKFQAIAPLVEKNLYLVPKVIGTAS